MLPQAQPELSYERLRLLLEINNAVVTTLDLHELMHTISEALQDVVPHDFTGLAIYDEETKELRVHATDTGEQRRVIAEGTPLSMDGTFPGVAITTRQTVLRHHIDLEEFHAPVIRQAYETNVLRSACAVPLMLQERMLGAVVLCGKTEGDSTRPAAEAVARASGTRI